MSLWARVNQLPQSVQDQVRCIYGDNFPIEVRHYLADWIEDRLLNAPKYLNEEEYNQQGDIFVQQGDIFVKSLIMELQRVANNLPEENVTIKMRLNESARHFELFSQHPVQLYQHMIDCLNRERQCVDQTNGCANVQEPEMTQLFNTVQEVQTTVRSNENDNRNLMQDHEQLKLEMQELQMIRTQLDTQETPEIRMLVLNQQKVVNDRLQLCTAKRLALVNGFCKTILLTNDVQKKVLHFLGLYKLTGRLCDTGASTRSTIHLDILQQLFISLAEIIHSTKDEIQLAINSKSQLNLDQEDVPDLLPQAQNDVDHLFRTLISNTLMIEKQPPQVLKTNTRFDATLRLLVGDTFNIIRSNLQVKVSIISEAQVQETQETSKASQQSCGEIVNNLGTISHNETTKQLSVIFSNMRLKKITRTVKQGTGRDGCVLNEKFALLFQTSFAVGDIICALWAISVPVVVAVHSNQESHCWATIIWDNAFYNPTRISFPVSPQLCWNQVVQALNAKFRAMTGGSLTAESLHFLCEKALMLPLPFPVPDDVTITWSHFCKELMPGRSSTFWDWFYAAMKLTSQHLRGPWMEGSIIGFISKTKAEDYLLTSPPGTFLLRFSESVLGTISIAWANRAPDGQLRVLHIQPFTAKDLTTRSLADRILDLDELLFLFPETPKHVTFSRSIKPKGPPSNTKYVPTEIRTVLLPIPTNVHQMYNEIFHTTNEIFL